MNMAAALEVRRCDARRARVTRAVRARVRVCSIRTRIVARR
jgi:hypothetical protein